MKQKLAILLVVVGILTGASAQAAVTPSTFTTGGDWARGMSDGEKYLSIMAPMSTLFQYGVPFRLRPEDYIPAMDFVIKNNPHLAGEDVSNIFASAAYLFEPETRAAFDALEMQFLQGNDYGVQPNLRVLRHLE